MSDSVDGASATSMSPQRVINGLGAESMFFACATLFFTKKFSSSLSFFLTIHGNFRTPYANHREYD
jgi:hypothetical protein